MQITQRRFHTNHEHRVGHVVPLNDPYAQIKGGDQVKFTSYGDGIPSRYAGLTGTVVRRNKQRNWIVELRDPSRAETVEVSDPHGHAKLLDDDGSFVKYEASPKLQRTITPNDAARLINAVEHFQADLEEAGWKRDHSLDEVLTKLKLIKG